MFSQFSFFWLFASVVSTARLDAGFGHHGPVCTTCSTTWSEQTTPTSWSKTWPSSWTKDHPLPTSWTGKPVNRGNHGEDSGNWAGHHDTWSTILSKRDNQDDHTGIVASTSVAYSPLPQSTGSILTSTPSIWSTIYTFPTSFPSTFSTSTKSDGKDDATTTTSTEDVKPTDWATNAKYACSPQVDALVAGIEISILAQHGELNATKDLQVIEAINPVNATAFAAGKAVLLSDIAFGIKIREFNQKSAPAGNDVVAGLKKYATAQAAEQDLANSLNGDPSHDTSILSTLVSDVTTGIQLNKNNTLAAVSKCYTPLVNGTAYFYFNSTDYWKGDQ